MYKRLALVGVVAALMVPVGTASADSGHGHHANHPETIDLPPGFVGEGVAVGAHNTWYAGSVADGRIARGDLREGTSDVFIDNPLVAGATGLKADLRHNLLWVSGAGTGHAAVYDLTTGAPIADLTLAAQPAFINDVIVTRHAAYFTNSFTPEIYRVPVSATGEVGMPETIALHGPAADFVAGQFNLNGIEATSNGHTLISVNSTTGQLFTIDPSTGDSADHRSRWRDGADRRRDPAEGQHAVRDAERQQPDAYPQPDRRRQAAPSLQRGPGRRRDHQPVVRDCNHTCSSWRHPRHGQLAVRRCTHRSRVGARARRPHHRGHDD